MTRRERGAASRTNERGAAVVSVMWVIVLLVLFFAACGAVYVAFDAQTALKQKIAEHETSLSRITKVSDERGSELRRISDEVGFYGDDPTAFANPEAIGGRVKALQEGYDYVGADVETLADLIDALTTRADALANQVRELQQQLKSEQDARAAAEENRRQVAQQKDQALAEIQQQLEDERDRASGMEQQQSERIDELQTQLADAQAESRAAADEADRLVSDLREQIRVREGRISEVSKKLEILREPEKPDGEVLAVSSVGTCYIDRGRRDLLRQGTRFEVFRYGKGGQRQPKGVIEVRSVMETQAEAGIVRVLDEYDPIAPGDLISAPLYDPEQQREFVLIGRFPAGYSKGLVADRLRALGATVSDKVTPSTDFLVVGAEEVVADPETESGDPTESEAYRTAQLYKVQILPVDEIVSFLRYN